MMSKKIKETLQNVNMPEDSKEQMKVSLLQQMQAENEKPADKTHRMTFRRIVLIAAAAVLLTAVAVGVFVALNRNAPEGNVPGITDVSVDITAGDDWVNGLFAADAIPNVAGKTESRDSNGDYFEDGKEKGYFDEPEWLEEPEGAAIGDKYIHYSSGKAIGDFDYSCDDYGDDIDGDGYPDFGGDNIIEPTAGLLTAGRRDDNAIFKEFQDALKDFGTYQSTWRIFPTRRYHVRVPGVGNAYVALAGEQGNVLAVARTNINGDAYLYYDCYTEQSSSKPYVIGVSNGDRFAEYRITGQETDVIEINCGEAKAPTQLDVLIMLDTTGSMGDELNYLQKEIEDVMDRVRKEAANATVRLSVNFYRDRGDDYTVAYNPFTEDVPACKELLMAEYANGGGDYPEAVDEALLNAVCDHAWAADAVKVMFIILDAPPHEESERQGVNDNIHKAIENAQKLGIRIVPVVASGIDDSTECLMRSVSALTGGTYAFLTDHSGIGGGHKEANVPQYTVEKLNDLMVNVILDYFLPQKTITDPAPEDLSAEEPKD